MPDPSLVAQLAVDGSIYDNWTAVRVTRTYGAAMSDFAFACAEPGVSGQGYGMLRIKPGQRCQILLAGIKVIDGYVTHRQVGYDANEHGVLIQGASLTRDIVKGSVEPGQLRGYGYQAIANNWTRKLKSKIVVKDPPAGWERAFRNVVPFYGESIWDALERYGRRRGIQHHDDKDGNLVLSGAPISGKSVADLVEGDNILGLSGTITDANVYSKVQAVAQDQGSDERFGKNVSQISATANNPLGISGLVKRVLLEGAADQKDAQTRADHEAGIDYATDVSVSVTVHGWLRPDGQLWDVRDPLSLYSPMFFPDSQAQSLGVRETTFLQDQQGSRTVLNLCLPNALSIISQQGVPKGEVPSILNSKPDAAQPDADAWLF